MFLLDDSWRRKSVGLVSGKSLYFAQPLLSPLYYVSRALEPFTELKRAPLDEGDSGIRALLDGGLSMLVLAPGPHDRFRSPLVKTRTQGE